MVLKTGVGEFLMSLLLTQHDRNVSHNTFQVVDGTYASDNIAVLLFSTRKLTKLKTYITIAELCIGIKQR